MESVMSTDALGDIKDEGAQPQAATGDDVHEEDGEAAVDGGGNADEDEEWNEETADEAVSAAEEYEEAYNEYATWHFIDAVEHMDPGGMVRALQRGADPRAMVNNGKTRAVSYIAYEHYVLYLYEDAADFRDWAVHPELLKQLRLEMLQELAKHGGFGDANETTALLRGVTKDPSRSGDAVIRLLLAQGADATFVDPTDGCTFAHRCVDSPEQLLLVAAAGANVTASDKLGCTPAHKVVQYSSQSWGPLSMLVALGADINARDSDGDTPLHIAIERCDPFMRTDITVWALLQLGADPTLPTAAGRDSVDLALQELVFGRPAWRPYVPLDLVMDVVMKLARARSWWRRRHALLAVRRRAASA